MERTFRSDHVNSRGGSSKPAINQNLDRSANQVSRNSSHGILESYRIQ